MPVNSPGPTSTAITLISESSTSACWHTNSIAGVERLGVAPAAAHLEQPEHALVPADRDAHLLGGGLDAEDQHVSAPSRNRAQGASADSSRAHRGAHERPSGATVDVTRTLVVVDRDRAGRGGGRRACEATTSPHSTRTIAVGLGQLGEREVGDLVLRAQPVEVGVVQRQPAARPCCRPDSCARA